MASPARARARSSPRINLIAAIRVIELLDLVWRREPTIFIELGVAWTVSAWAVTILLFGMSGYPPPISDSIGRLPELLLGVTGAAFASAQVASVVMRHRTARGYCSFAGAIWLGYLSFTILAGNPTLAGGWVYLGAAVAALLPFWRVVLDRPV